MDVTPAELMMLGLVAERPRHGYDIEKTIEERGMREWTDLAFSSIYYLLGRLAKAQLVEAIPAESTAAGGDRRMTYALTAHGLAVAHEAIQAALREVTPVHAPVLVGLANLPLLSHDDAIGALRERIDRLAAELSRLQTHPRAQMPVAPLVAAIFSHAVSALRCELGWARRTIKILEDSHAEDRSQDGTQGSLPTTAG